MIGYDKDRITFAARPPLTPPVAIQQGINLLNKSNIFMVALKRADLELCGYFKLVCVVRMVVDTIQLHAEIGPNDHRKDALPFSSSALCTCLSLFLDWSDLILEMKHLVRSQDMQVVHFLSPLHTTVFLALHI